MTQLPRAQVVGSIDTPGLAITPPVDPGVTQMQQLMTAMGQVGQTAEQLGAYWEDKRRRREADQAKIDATLREQAAHDIRMQLPEFQAGVEAGKYDILFADMGEDETISQRAQDYVASKFSNEAGQIDVPQVYADVYHRELTPIVTRLLVARSQASQAESRDWIKTRFREGLVSASSPDDIRARLEGAKLAAGLDDDEAKELLVPALRLNAQLGDQQRVPACPMAGTTRRHRPASWRKRSGYCP